MLKRTSFVHFIHMCNKTDITWIKLNSLRIRTNKCKSKSVMHIYLHSEELAGSCLASEFNKHFDLAGDGFECKAFSCRKSMNDTSLFLSTVVNTAGDICFARFNNSGICDADAINIRPVKYL